MPGDMTKKQQAALAVKLQQFNEWRMADPDRHPPRLPLRHLRLRRPAPEGADVTATITDLFCGAGGSFARRARQEREIGHAICSTEVRINGRRDKIPVFLDELEPGRGNYAAEVEHECGVFCAGVEATWTDEEEACDV